MATYDVKSSHADEFINHEEILATLSYAQEHKDDIDLCRAILAKAHPNVAPKHEHCTCITHREAAVLRTEYTEEGIECEAVVPADLFGRVKAFIPGYVEPKEDWE